MAKNAGRKDGRTRTRILAAAVRVFAKKGYRDARVAEICRGAGANVAAINYYFGSKENLYCEALKLAFRQSLERHPIDGGVTPGAPAEERLRGHILATVRRMSDPRGYEFDIIRREMAEPTGLVTEILIGSIEPIRRTTQLIVREIVGEKASDELVALCQQSIMGQCLHFMLRGRPGIRPVGPPAPRFDAEVIAEHIFRFSLAGLREVRQQIESASAADIGKHPREKAGTP